jgi:hypothetical protein
MWGWFHKKEPTDQEKADNAKKILKEEIRKLEKQIDNEQVFIDALDKQIRATVKTNRAAASRLLKEKKGHDGNLAMLDGKLAKLRQQHGTLDGMVSNRRIVDATRESNAVMSTIKVSVDEVETVMVETIEYVDMNKDVDMALGQAFETDEIFDDDELDAALDEYDKPTLQEQERFDREAAELARELDKFKIPSNNNPNNPPPTEKVRKVQMDYT